MATVTSMQLALIGLGLATLVGPTEMAYAQSGPSLPTCTGWGDCNRGRGVCTFANREAYFGPIVVSDFADGVSSDGRGRYIQDTDGVQWTVVVLGNAGLSLRWDPDSVEEPRTYRVNLNDPVPGGGGIPLGRITSGNDENLYTAWKREETLSVSLQEIPVGQTVTAAQMNVSVHIDGHFYILQMGPLPLGHCHADSTRVHGAGTSSGTIYRAGPTKWVMDLPAGSVGRLFDVSNTMRYALDKGLYYVRLHYVIGN